jgi:hypothetical protein
MTDKLIARFDELGMYELQDPRLLDLISTSDLAIGGGIMDTVCASLDGVCGNNTVCGNTRCFNNLCFNEPMNNVCNQDVNTVC